MTSAHQDISTSTQSSSATSAHRHIRTSAQSSPTSARDYFPGKKAFITGSSRGIGRAIALKLAQAGCDILVHYRRSADSARATAETITKLGRQTWIYQADLCDTAQTTAMLEKIRAEHRELDIFVANAAATAFKSLMDVSESNIRKTLDLSLTSFLACVQNLRPLMASRNARLLTISGIDTRRYCPGHGLLACAKAALETLTSYLAVELSGDGIRTKCLNPGLVASDSTRLYLGDAFQEICAAADVTAPVKGFAEPETVADIALRLLHPDTDWISTGTVVADGGLGFMLPGMGGSP